MPKLHEILAVEGDLSAQAAKAAKNTKQLFSQPQKLTGLHRIYRPLDEDGQPLSDEITNMATTVDQELTHALEAFGNWLDVSIQKEQTNQQTAANVESLGIQLSAPALLNLESKLASLRDLFSAIPTNDTTERWHWDEQAGCFVSEPRFTYKTEKTVNVVVGYPATPEHPAQVQYINSDERVGEWTAVIQSGMWQPNKKREVMARLDKLLAEVKQARQRANNIEITPVQIANTVLKYILE